MLHSELVKRSVRRRFGFLRKQLELLAALALTLLASDHVLPALHHAFVAHELCPEHGVLEHPGELRERTVHEAGRAFVDAASDSDAHEHCDSVPASPPRSSAVAAFDAVFAPLTSAGEPAVSDAPAVLTADVLTFAPKQSPPG